MNTVLDLVPLQVWKCDVCILRQISFFISVPIQFVSAFDFRLLRAAKCLLFPAPVTIILIVNCCCRYNMRQYWLPTTLSLYPSVHQNILSELSAQPGSLPALITVYRECKKTKIITQLHIDDSLKNALCSANDEIRSDVIALICLSSKPSGLFLVHSFFFLQDRHKVEK